MITANDLRPNSVFELDGELYSTISKKSSHTGRGGATVRVKLRNLRRGSTFERTFGPDVRLDDVRLETRQMQYLYNDGALYYFMDTETYEQPAINAAALAGKTPYLKEEMMLGIAFYNEEAIDIELPPHVELKVTYTEPGVRGDTAQGAKKAAETESGLTVQVPLFINMGDIIVVDTRNGQYLTRA
ncbi:MAG: elongation factor P [Ardenticatenaceae bacterium]